MEKPDKISNPFRVPENYFSEVNRKIISAASEHKPEVPKRSLYSRLVHLTGIAALISGLVLISYLLLKSHEEPGTILPEISFLTFSESYLNEIELSTLEENIVLFISDDVPDVSSSEIVDYLILDNININEIYEEL